MSRPRLPEEVDFLCRGAWALHDVLRLEGLTLASRPEIRNADPTARRQAVQLVLAGACFGAVLILLFERYRIPLRDWVLANPGSSAQRTQLVILLLAVTLFAPLLALGGYLWSLGARESRGGLLRMLGISCSIACAVLFALLWRLVSVLSF
jgi:hypothetical protein